MHIRFDLDFDGDPWPGPLQRRDAVAGEVWVGPLGLLSRLETALGLGGRWQTRYARVAQLMAKLATHDGFWSRSAEADPLGVARTLLGWRDTLRMAGWRGGAVGAPRIDALARLTEGLPSGVPDRLDAVCRRLETRGVEIERVDVLARPAELSMRWRAVFDGLRARGTRVAAWSLTPARAALSLRAHAEQPLESARRLAVATGGRERRRARTLRFSSSDELPAVSDLARCASAGFVPMGDGSLQLFRPHGPLQAADEVAAWLAAQRRLDDIVIVGADAVLDAALRRHGLPITGADHELPPRALFQVLPLVLEVALRPCDPQKMLELLLLPLSPIEPSLAGRLADALQQWPAVDSGAWREALAGEAAHPLLRPAVARDGEYPVEVATTRVEAVEAWLRTLDDVSGAAAAVEQCRLLSAALRTAGGRFGDALMPLPHLRRLVRETADAVSEMTPTTRECGLRAVASPGAVAGPVGRVVWWNFTRQASGALERLPFSGVERAALERAGVVLPSPSDVALARAARFRRPLQQALEATLLVAPRQGANGDEQFVHPLFDEIRGNCADARQAARLETDVPSQSIAATRVTFERRPLPQGRHAWRVAALPMRAVESPSSLATLVECSAQYALRYVGRLRPGRSATLAQDNTLLGRVAHEMMAAIFAEGAVTPEAAFDRARSWVMEEGPRHAAALFLAENHATLRAALRVMSEAARDFAVLLQGRRVDGVERLLRSSEAGYVLEGRADLLVEGGVIDFKWGGGAHYVDKLRNGSASQLAAYARMAGHDAVAYYVMRERRLLQSAAAHGRALPGAGGRVDGPSMSLVWCGFEAAIAGRRNELAEGRLFAEGHAELRLAHGRLDDGLLRLPPSCHFCDFTKVCGAHG